MIAHLAGLLCELNIH